MAMEKKQAKIIKVENNLKKKAGHGDISDVRISRAEQVLVSDGTDFREIASPFLAQLQEAVHVVRQARTEEISDLLPSLINPVMELKANAPMFQYGLVGNLASIMLSFLEHINALDKDAIDIIGAHEKTLSAIIGKGMKGDGGPLGAQLTGELEEACNRYYRKNPDSFKKFKKSDVELV